MPQATTETTAVRLMGLPDPARSRAVLIGVDRYDYMADLPAVRNNVRRLAELLRDRDLWGLPPEHCVVMHNPTSADAVLDAVHEAASSAEDAFVLYFAGHGLVSPTDGADLRLALPGSDHERWYRAVSYDALRHALVDTCRASARVVLLDCCYSGRALQGYMSPPQMVDLAAVEGAYMMTAASETRLAHAPEGEEFTAFSGELVKALTEGIPDAGDPLDMGTLYRHLRRELVAKGHPVPQQRARNAGHNIALTRNRWGTADIHEPREDPTEPEQAADEPPDGPAARRRPSRRTLLLGALGAGAASAVAVPLTLDRLSDSSAKGASEASPRSTSPSPKQAPRFTEASAGRELTAVDFSRDGFIAVGDKDGGVALWVSHLPEPEIAAVLSEPGDPEGGNSTLDLAFSPDGSLLASVDDSATITLWDVASRKKTATLNGDERKGAKLGTLAFSADGKTLAHSANSNTITLWDVRTHHLLATLVDPDAPTLRGNKGAVFAMKFTRDSRTLIASVYEDKLRFWDIRQRRVTATVQKRGEFLIRPLEVSLDGKVLAASVSGGIQLWHLGSRKEIELLTNARSISAIAFSPDGKSLAAAEMGGVVNFWSTSTWNRTGVLDERVEGAAGTLERTKADETFAAGLFFSPDGKLLVEALGYTLVLWKLT